MENASKALIIAGAILLSILLISLGIMVFNQAQDTIGNSGISKAQISTFNSAFTKYEGNLKNGTDVKALISEINASNASDKADNNDREITITVDGKAVTTTSSVSSVKKYDVSFETDGNTGYINKAVIVTHK